jgi:hypothetical protein
VARKIAVLVACVAAGGALFALGRASVDRDDTGDARMAGIRAGRAAGVQEGRALQLGESLPRDQRRAARRAFSAGYVAGANDVFGGFDGGWSLTDLYLIKLRRGSGAITYRIDSRRALRSGTQP